MKPSEMKQTAVAVKTFDEGGRGGSCSRQLYEFKKRLDIRMNDYLCEMKPSHDDSITGFNEAWKLMCRVFDDECSP